MTTMRWPRKGILIRILIYVPIIGYLAWAAAGKWRAEREATEGAAELDTIEPGETPYRQKIKMPDGTEREVTIVTPEQAEEILGGKPGQVDHAAAEPAGD